MHADCHDCLCTQLIVKNYLANNEAFMTVSARMYVCAVVCVCARVSLVYLDMHVQISRSVAQYQHLHQSSSEPGGYKSAQVLKRIFASATFAAMMYCSPRQRVRSTSRAHHARQGR